MSNPDSLESEWPKVEAYIKELTGKTPDLNAIIFLIGIQELGKGLKSFSKEQKQDLMHIGICKLLSQTGYYDFEGRDEDGWPHWKLVRPLPFNDLLGQETMLKEHIIQYFKNEINNL